MYHVLVRGYSGMVLPDTVVLDHLLQPSVQALGAQPLKFLNLQLLFSLEKKNPITHVRTHTVPHKIGQILSQL